MEAEGIPASIATAWGVRDQPRKGPKPALTLQRIIDAAVRVADAEGLGAVSMGRVAAEAGTAPMSLYRHVANKEELIDHMLDAAWYSAAEYSPTDEAAPDLSGGDWRAGLSHWAWQMRAAARQHPWAIRIPIKTLPIMPNEVAWFENALACMAGTGLSESQKASVIMLLSGYVRNLAATEADIWAAMQASGLAPDQWMSSYAQMLRKLTNPRDYPALAVFLESDVFDKMDHPDDEFIFGLDRILDGIAALIDAGR